MTSSKFYILPPFRVFRIDSPMLLALLACMLLYIMTITAYNSILDHIKTLVCLKYIYIYIKLFLILCFKYIYKVVFNFTCTFLYCMYIYLCIGLLSSTRHDDASKGTRAYSWRAWGAQTGKCVKNVSRLYTPCAGWGTLVGRPRSSRTHLSGRDTAWRTSVRLTGLTEHDVIPQVFSNIRDQHGSSAQTCWVWGYVAFINIPVISGRKTSPLSRVSDIRTSCFQFQNKALNQACECLQTESLLFTSILH